MKRQMSALVVGAFAQEQIGAGAELDQLIVPSAVAREHDRFAAAVDPERQRYIRLGVRTANRAHLELAQPGRGLWLEHHELHLVPDLVELEMREHRARQ